MLHAIAIVLITLWFLGLLTSYTAGGALHVLLGVAVILVAARAMSSRRVARTAPASSAASQIEARRRSFPEGLK